MQEKVKQIQ